MTTFWRIDRRDEGGDGRTLGTRGILCFSLTLLSFSLKSSTSQERVLRGLCEPFVWGFVDIKGRTNRGRARSEGPRRNRTE